MVAPKNSSYLNTRALATRLVVDVMEKGQSLNQVLPIYKKHCKTKEDKGFVQALAFGVLRGMPRFVFIVNRLLQKPLREKDSDILYLLTIGLLQLIDLKIPAHAAIAETVEATRILKKSWATGLVNAVLRNFQRSSKNIFPLEKHEEAFYAHPTWLIEALKRSWPQHWQSILIENNIQAPLSLRINLGKISKEAYLQLLEKEEVIADPIVGTKGGIILKEAYDVQELPGFNEGLFSVQDGAAQLAADLLDLKPGFRVLDACAAPGGKTTHILEAEPLLSEVVAVDLEKTRSALIVENLQRLGLRATVKTADAAEIKTWWNGELFDRILLDAPCTATGVIRRHPDIKYLRRQNDIPKINRQQLRLLHALWPTLKPNGILLYATCSIFPEENELLIQEFLKTISDATPVPFTLIGGIAQTVGSQLLPGQNKMDGFYYARIRKTYP